MGRCVVALALLLGGCAMDRAPEANGGPLDGDAGDAGDAGAEDTEIGDDTGPPPDPLTCADLDGDGFAGTGETCLGASDDFDCDDADTQVHPGAVERCNQRDDNCDGVVDEGVDNLCGGCAPFADPPGQVCEDCGRVECAGAEATVCTPDLGNGCGGCERLAGVPDQRCGECGVFACTGPNSVECTDRGRDACGFCGPPERVEGGPCGSCADGTWSCGPGGFVCLGSTRRTRFWRDVDGDGAGVSGDHLDLCGPEAPYVATTDGDCDDEDPRAHPRATERCDAADNDCDGIVDEGLQNDCGGCATLPGTPGASCGDCAEGRWTCDGGDRVLCVGVDINLCGGCTSLPGSPGDPCGECGSLACDGVDALSCSDDGGNVCGGCSALMGNPGDACGQCGRRQCQDAELRCVDTPPNACGGCSRLDRTPGDDCGICGSWTCQGPDSVACDERPRNGCGGCDALAGQPGASCGQCGRYACAGQDRVVCDDPGRNACGGCAVLVASPGASCGDCGEYACNGDNEVRCTGDVLNACGGCGALEAEPGDDCGNCGAWGCLDANSVRCSDPGRNACGGCTVLPSAPGTPCGDCGSRTCNGQNAVRCDDPGYQQLWRDQDRDGFGGGSPQNVCEPTGEIDATNGDDCDDTNTNVNPNATTDPCDGLDNDCDEQVDENPACGPNRFCVEGECICLEECGVACCRLGQCCNGNVCGPFCQ